MGKEFSRIDNPLDPCLTSQGLNDAAALLGHNRDKNDSSKMQIKYSLKERGEMRLQILTKGGHPIRMLEANFKEPGSYIFEMNPFQLNLPPGDYMYRLEFAGKRYQRGILL